MLLLLRAAKFLLCCVLYRERMGSRPLHKNACECAKIKSCRRRRKEGGKKVETKTKLTLKSDFTRMTQKSRDSRIQQEMAMAW